MSSKAKMTSGTNIECGQPSCSVRERCSIQPMELRLEIIIIRLVPLVPLIMRNSAHGTLCCKFDFSCIRKRLVVGENRSVMCVTVGLYEDLKANLKVLDRFG